MSKAIQGTVANKSGDKTVRVRIIERRTHPKYKKIYSITKHMIVHDEKNQCALGDEVSIVPCKPMSKTKSWAVQDVVKKSDAAPLVDSNPTE